LTNEKASKNVNKNITQGTSCDYFAVFFRIIKPKKVMMCFCLV